MIPVWFLILIRLVDSTFYVVYICILLVVLRSWLQFEIPRFLRKTWWKMEEIVESFFGFFRRYVPFLQTGGVALDLSPIFAILLLEVLHTLIKRFLWFLI